MTSKPVVWIVDDLPSNLKTFADSHARAFRVRKFSHPSEVLQLISDGERPDALLCDVFFYDTPQQAEAIEVKITGEVVKLQHTAHDIGADEDKYLAGIKLM